jgi:hypothetical protein
LHCRGSIEYDATTTLTSFESALVKNKLRAHFQAAVERIVAAKPDVLLVGASVDQMAIAMLEVSSAGGFANACSCLDRVVETRH